MDDSQVDLSYFVGLVIDETNDSLAVAADDIQFLVDFPLNAIVVGRFSQ